MNEKEIMEAPKSNKRFIHLDVVAGFMIIYMVLYHCGQWSNTSDNLFMKSLEQMLFFFMSWFFFKAGMFFKQGTKLSVCVLSSAKRLIVPFIIYTIIAMPVYAISLILTNRFDLIVFLKDQLLSVIYCGSAPANLPLWFLPTLFAVRVVAKGISGISVKLCLLGGGLAMFLNYIEFRYPFWFSNICSGLFFFSLGYLLNSIQYRKSVLVISICGYAAALICPSIVDFRSNALQCGYYILWQIFSICGCVFFNNVFFRIGSRSPIFKPIQIAGENSMFIYTSHWIIFLLLKISLTGLEISLTNCQRLILYVSVMVLVYSLILTYKLKRCVK